MVHFQFRVLLVSIVAVFFFCIPNAFSQERELLGEECYKILHDDLEATVEKRRECRVKFEALPRLVITPTRRAIDLRDVPASASVVTAQDIERAGADSLAEALRDVPGVEVTDAGQPGLKRIRIRGEESRRVTVLIDGQEFADEREVGTPLLIAPEMVERIEVLRGTGSVLHGSRAIGGVVNIVTKKGGYHPVQATASSTFDSATGGTQNFLSLYGRSHGIDYRVAGTVADHDDRRSAGGEVDNTSFESDSFSVYLGKRLENHALAMSFDNFNSSSEVYVDPVVATSPPFLDFRIDAPQRDRRKVALFYEGTDLSEVVSKIGVDGYYQVSDREFNTLSDIAIDSGIRRSEIFSSSTLDTQGLNGQIDIQLPANNLTVIGTKLKQDDLEQSRRVEVNGAGIASPSQLIFDDANQASYELFAENEWTFQERWALNYGARGVLVRSELEGSTRDGLTPQSINDEDVVASVGLRFHPSDPVTLWAGYSQGFVYPTLINLGTGAFAGPSFVNPNPELNSESSDSFEIGARYNSENVSIDSSVFYTESDDYISHVLCSSVTAKCIQPPGARDRVYVNLDQATTFGAEATFSTLLLGTEYYTSASWIRREFEMPDFQTYDTGLPTLSGRIGGKREFEVGQNIQMWVDGYMRIAESAEEITAISTIHHSGWATLNTAIGADFGEQGQYRLVLDLQNLGDKSYIVATESVPARGRSAILKFVVDL